MNELPLITDFRDMTPECIEANTFGCVKEDTVTEKLDEGDEADE